MAHPQRAVVTGGGSGIGRAVVLRLLQNGVSVLAADRNPDGLAEVAEHGADTLLADVTRAADRSRLVADGGPIDYLVNAAGVIQVSDWRQVDTAQWRTIFEVNAEAVFFLCRDFAALIRPRGAIVNVGSMAAKTGEVEAAAYAAAKAAVLSITRSFATALAPQGVRVNSVSPGIIDTPMQDQVVQNLARIRETPVETLLADRLRAVPLGRVGSAAEVADLIAFLLSDSASYVTGEDVNVSGGLVTW